jgi:hypothetical protein
MAVTIQVYNSFYEKLTEGFNMGSDSFKVILLDNSHSFNAAHTQLSDVSANEIATGSGYTQQSKTLASVTSAQSSGTYTFDAADVTWTASGGAISAYHAVIYNDTDASDSLVCSINFDGQQTAADGADFKLIWNASGIFTLAAA